MSLLTEQMENINEKLDSTCAQFRAILDSNLDVKHKNLDRNIEHLQKRLQDECLKSKYFDPSSFLGSMEKLPKMMLKVICCRERTEDSDTILDLLTSSILFAQQLTNAGYNKNVKKKTEKEFKECCIYLDPMDDKVELLRKIICGHLFYSRCVNKWFEDKETHKYLICPM